MRDAHDLRKIAEALLAQAELCDHIAAACANDAEAAKFKRQARQCRDAAARNNDMNAGAKFAG